MVTHSTTLPRKSHRKRSLVGYGPQGCKESATAEHTHTNSLMHFDEAFADLAPSQLVDLWWNCKYKWPSLWSPPTILLRDWHSVSSASHTTGLFVPLRKSHNISFSCALTQFSISLLGVGYVWFLHPSISFLIFGPSISHMDWMKMNSFPTLIHIPIILFREVV